MIEGVGGWLVPLNEKTLIADIIIELKIPIILVVGIRLSCINHALLTWSHCQQHGAMVLGWIANCLDAQMLAQDENIRTLQQWLPIPCLKIIPFLK